MAWDDHRERKPVVGAALVGKALRLLEVIGAGAGPLDARRMQAETGWTRPTLYRILSVLAGEGYVQRDPASKGYTLGFRFLDLAQNSWAGSELVVVASLDLQRLRNLTGETAYLAVPHPEGVLSLGKFESPHAVRSAAQLGALKPYHCTSQGKAMLAFWETGEIRRRLGRGPYRRYTAATVVNPVDLGRQLTEIRARGFAIENEEIMEGRRCVGAPILDERGQPIGAISVAGPAWRLTRERAEQLGPEVAEVAGRIGDTLRAQRPTRRAVSGAWAVRTPAEPAFYGADPCWVGERSELRWVDRLGQALHVTGAEGDAVHYLPLSRSIRSAVRLAGRTLIFAEGCAWSVSDTGEAGALNVGPSDVSAACTGPGESVWLAVSQGDGSSIGRLVGTEFEPVWPVAGRIGVLALRPDGRVVAADPERGLIYQGAPGLAGVRILSRIPAASGQPRALALDDADRLWVALYDGWAIARLDADGELTETIPLPVPRPTGLTIGGVQGRTLFATTARYGLSPETLREAPLSGSVLHLDVSA